MNKKSTFLLLLSLLIWDRGVYHYSAGYSWVHLSQYFVTVMSYAKNGTPGR